MTRMMKKQEALLDEMFEECGGDMEVLTCEVSVSPVNCNL